MNITKTYYHSIDVFRFICAIFVVTVHITSHIPSHDIATWTNYYSYRYLLDIGSPFFFMAAGFILFHKSSDQGHLISSHMERRFFPILSYSPYSI